MTYTAGLYHFQWNLILSIGCNYNTDVFVVSGLEADQKVVAAHGCYAMTATTALTAQNTQGVRGIHVIPTEFVSQQIDACVEDVGVDVVKTGELINQWLI